MNLIDLIIRLHEDAERQGPGSEESTIRALELTGLLNAPNISILDVGCGSGAQTITLVEHTKGIITAVDLYKPFLDKLKCRAEQKGLDNRIKVKNFSMDQMTFNKNEFDLLWSEGAIYNMGFENGLRQWKQYIKINGYIAVTEISWLTYTRPKEVEEYWSNEYKEIDIVSNKIAVIEKLGYKFIGAFMLPEYCWEDNYYKPMENRFKNFLEKNKGEEAKEIVNNEIREMKIYRKYKDYYSYVFYIAQNK